MTKPATRGATGATRGATDATRAATACRQCSRAVSPILGLQSQPLQGGSGPGRERLRFTKKESKWCDLFVREKRAESAICKADVDAMARTLWPVLLLSQWREPRRTVVKDDEYARREETMAMLVTKRNTFKRVRLP